MENVQKSLEVEEVSRSDVGRKRSRPDASSDVRPYVPEWSVLATDSTGLLALERIKDVGVIHAGPISFQLTEGPMRGLRPCRLANSS